MRKIGVISMLVAIFMVVGMTAPALASNVHLKPPNQNPAFTDLGLVLNSQGNLAGLGFEDVLVKLTAQANVAATCTNPGTGEQRPPGQNPAPITVTGSEAIPKGEIKNGNTPFNVSTAAPQTPIPGAPGCPNPNWVEDITDLAFTSAVIAVEQPVGTTVLTVSCTFNPPTTDGPVPDRTVSCTSA